MGLFYRWELNSPLLRNVLSKNFENVVQSVFLVTCLLEGKAQDRVAFGLGAETVLGLWRAANSRLVKRATLLLSWLPTPPPPAPPCFVLEVGAGLVLPVLPFCKKNPDFCIFYMRSPIFFRLPPVCKITAQVTQTHPCRIPLLALRSQRPTYSCWNGAP